MLDSIIQWVFIALIISPLPYAVYKKYKYGQVTRTLTILSTISFVLFSLILSVILYTFSKFYLDGIFGKTTIVLLTAFLTFYYYRFINKKVTE